jgi:hypothetical protein
MYGARVPQKAILADYARAREETRALIHEAHNQRLASRFLRTQAIRIREQARVTQARARAAMTERRGHGRTFPRLVLVA